jgi:hypothetical protein
MDLKNTQGDLLKTLKNLYDLKPPPKVEVTGPFKDLADELNSIKEHLEILKPNKYIKSDKESFFYNLPKFYQYLSDVSGSNIDFKYKNDYKINPLIKLDISSIDDIDKKFQKLKPFIEKNEQVNLNLNNVKPNIENINFNERQEPVDVNFSNINPDTKNINFNERQEPVNVNFSNINPDTKGINFNERQELVDVNFSNINPNTKGINFNERQELVDVNFSNINPDKKNINFTEKHDYKNDEIVKEYKNIVEKEISQLQNELREVTKILARIKLTTLNLSIYTSDKYLNEIKKLANNLVSIEESNLTEKSIVTDLNQYLSFKQIDLSNKTINIKNKTYNLDNNLFGGSNNLLNINESVTYVNLLKDKELLIKDFKESIDKHNVVYIHYYYYQLFILKNINQNSDKPREIYQFIKKSNFLFYWNTLYRLNESIKDPEKNPNIYFKYYIIIKVLFTLFDTIKNKWNNKPDTYKINIFKTDNKDIAKWFVIFNLFYPILLKI